MSPARVAAGVLALLLAGFALWRRRRLGTERAGLALLAAAALGVYASGVLSLLPDPKKLIGDAAHALGPWTYALVAVFSFLETGAFVGLVAPGETIVMAGGVIAGQGEIELLPLIGLVWACAVLGDTTSFFIGRRLGRGFILRRGPRLKITPERLEQVEGYFERHGGKTILVGRFIGLVRALAPFVAGSSGFPYRRFLPFSVVGTGLWATLFCVLGYVFWQSFDRVAHVAGQAVLGFGIVVGVVVGVVWAVRRLRQPEQRRKLNAWLDRQQRRPFLRPPIAAARKLAPAVSFVWNRATPGEFALELITVLAAAGVGAYVCVLYAARIAHDAGPTALDGRVLDFAHSLKVDVAVEVVKAFAVLGAFPTVAALVFGTSALLTARGKRSEPLALVGGLLLVYLAVHVMKAGFDRPRPIGGLSGARGAAFPSGPAAYSTAWVAAAVALSSRLGLAGRASLVLGGIAICAVVGLSGIYLRVQWFSDVAAGWGLGFAIFGLMATFALIVTHIRHNERSWTSTSRPSRSPSP